MNDVMRDPLKMLTEGEMPSPDAIRDCFNAIMDGEVSQIRMAAFLTALKIRGERVEDISAAAGNNISGRKRRAGEQEEAGGLHRGR